MLVRNKLCFDSADLASLTRFYVPWGRGGRGGEQEREANNSADLAWFYGREGGTHASFPPGLIFWGILISGRSG